MKNFIKTKTMHLLMKMWILCNQKNICKFNQSTLKFDIKFQTLILKYSFKHLHYFFQNFISYLEVELAK